MPHGYRLGFSATELLLSFLTWHNETVNIWSHVAPALFFAYVGATRAVGAAAPGADVSRAPLWAEYLFSHGRPLDEALEAEMVSAGLTFYAACAVTMFLLSGAVYHGFASLSRPHHNLFLKLDLIGIAVMFAGSYTPAVLMGFRCARVARASYLTLALATLVTGILAGLRVIPENWGTPVFIALGAVGLVPAGHWLVVAPPHLLGKLGGFLLLYFALYGAGVLFYVTRFPERSFPQHAGTLSYIGHSHNFWHLFVFLAALWWWKFLLYSVQLVQDGELACAAAPR